MKNNVDTAVELFLETYTKIHHEIAKIVVGNDKVIQGILIALIANGNVLLEGVPGIGKTLLIKTLSNVLDLKYSRIQFTPDLMPADIIGTKVILETEGGKKEYEFQQGPVFANIVLADEINRASPKTQSALLEVMEEHTVTVAGISYPMVEPYIVLATQNPIEMEGTYPLPEAQKDRFFFQLNVGYPNETELQEIGRRITSEKLPEINKIADSKRIKQMSDLAAQVPLPEAVEDLAIKLVSATHPEHGQTPPMVQRYVKYGSSPRGFVTLLKAGKIKALLNNRFNVSKQDILSVLHAALRHRLILTFEADAEGVNVDEIIDTIIKHFS
ncbi:MoxR family ATPase [bacterium]|nr:MoxR family ATPase [bacterium]